MRYLASQRYVPRKDNNLARLARLGPQEPQVSRKAQNNPHPKKKSEHFTECFACGVCGVHTLATGYNAHSQGPFGCDCGNASGGAERKPPTTSGATCRSVHSCGRQLRLSPPLSASLDRAFRRRRSLGWCVLLTVIHLLFLANERGSAARFNKNSMAYGELGGARQASPNCTAYGKLGDVSCVFCLVLT